MLNFNSLFALLVAVAVPGSVLLLAFALKGAVILGAAGLLSLAQRRASAAVRHLVWLLAILGVLCLPLLSLVVPPLRLPAAAPVSAPASSAVPPLSAPAAFHTAVSMPPQTEEAEQAPEFDPWPVLLTIFWAIIACLALARLGLGFFLAGRVTRRCLPVTNPVLRAEMRRLTQTTGLRRSVWLRQGAVAVPMTTGLCRPVVLLPADAGAWPTDRLRAALRHELAHVARRDWAWHGLAGVACALHWFNPLVWLAARQLRESSERACDDAVLAAGIPPADYAGCLLEIARQLSARGAARPGAAVAMAQRPQVEDRLRAILGAGLDRRGLTRRYLLLALAAAALVLLPLAAFRTQAQEHSGADARWEAHKQTVAQEQAKDKARWAARKIELSNLRHLKLIGQAVLDYAHSHGGRLPDADRWVEEIAPVLSAGSPQLLRSFMQDPAAPTQPYGYAFNRSLSGVNLAAIKYPANVALVFESALGRRNAADTGASVPSPGRYHGGSHFVFADGQARWVRSGVKVSFSPATSATTLPMIGPFGSAGDTGRLASVDSDPNVPANLNVRSWGTGGFIGRVVYEDGRPAAYVRVGAQMLTNVANRLSEYPPGKNALSRTILHFPPGAARTSPKQVVQLSWGEDVTGPDGTYYIRGLTSAPYNVAILTRDPTANDNGNDPWVAKAIENAPAEEGKTVALPNLVLTSGGFAAGRVTGAAGQPIGGIWIGSHGPHRPASSAMFTETHTGQDGRYRLRLAPGSSQIFVLSGAPGSSLMVISPGRWKQGSVMVNVAKGETKTADFQLKPRDPSSPPDFTNL